MTNSKARSVISKVKDHFGGNFEKLNLIIENKKYFLVLKKNKSDQVSTYVNHN